jgi:hypothetical protein
MMMMIHIIITLRIIIRIIIIIINIKIITVVHDVALDELGVILAHDAHLITII